MFKPLIMSILFFPALILSTKADQPKAPNGKAPDMSKPVQVFVLMGQPNMLGFGKISKLQGVAKEKYPY